VKRLLFAVSEKLVAAQTESIVHELASLLNLLAPTLEALQTAGGIPKLYRRPDLNISRLGVFPVEKVHDQSVLEPHEK
jgi:hypothetical protein